jgi:predicted butyrate kinase (DUF1464 family)
MLKELIDLCKIIEADSFESKTDLEKKDVLEKIKNESQAVIKKIDATLEVSEYELILEQISQAKERGEAKLSAPKLSLGVTNKLKASGYRVVMVAKTKQRFIEF